MVADRIEIVDGLLSRLLGPLGSNHKGAVYGLDVDGTTVVVGAAGQSESSEAGEKKDIELVNEMLPCGIEPIGVFICTEESSPADGIFLLKQLPPPQQETQIPILFLKEGSSLKAFHFKEDELIPAKLETISENEFKQKTTTIRVRAKLDLTCGFTQKEIATGFKHLIEKVICPYGSYVMEGNQVMFLHSFVEKSPTQGWAKSPGDVGPQEEEEDCQIVGIADAEDVTVDELWQYTDVEEEDDGFGSKGDKKKKVTKRERLEFTLLWNLTNPACTSKTIGCAPIIYFKKETGRTISVPILIDALGVVASSCKAKKELMEVLKGSVARQIGDIAASVMSEFSIQKTISKPQVYHFKPNSIAHYITIVYPTKADNCTFENYRKSMHDTFMLPMDAPALRKSNALQFTDPGYKGKLVNVHEGILDKHGVAGGQVAAVQGLYTYHHYMQDNFDDDQWGCAYRSLQTIISWFRHQGYTETKVPTHREIQKCLVDIGDKEAKFIGSKQWIGSTEVGFVLETACNVQSRFISVSSGAQLVDKAADLIKHFESEGTPIMIGGGVYAHTILGVAYDEATENCSWLILDPHYTGSDDLKTILSKGWCGWKGAKFWNQTAFYNMCLPQRMKNII